MFACSVLSVRRNNFVSFSTMTPLPNSESVARIAENMDDKPPTYSSSLDGTKILSSLRPNATSRNGVKDKLDLRNESDRLRTFETWTVPFIEKRDLAAAGFYYTEISDIVRCPFCELELGRWVQGDDPLADHRKHSPSCMFVLQKTGTCCSPQVPPPDESPSSLGEDSCGPYGLESEKSPTLELERRARNTMLEKLKINQSDIPKYPNYSTNEDRLKSFENWPISSKIPPDMLSMAGFVYTQSDDGTFCFHCGGSVHSWDEYDEPWVEHAHWFPKCKFVLSMRGQKFIDDARTKKHEDLVRTSEEMKNALESIKEIVFAVDVNTVTNNKNIKDSPSEGSSSNATSTHSQDTETSSSSSHSIDEGLATCLICLAEKRNTVLLPCYHVVGCAECVNKLKNCCVCREPIIYRRRLYFS